MVRAAGGFGKICAGERNRTNMSRPDFLQMAKPCLVDRFDSGQASPTNAAIRLFATALLASAVLVVTGCASTTTGGAVGTERRQLLLISSAQLDQVAAQSYVKLQADASQKGALNTDSSLTQRVRAIAAHIEPHTAVFRRDAPGWKWEVNVINSKELNAFCMPGGKIAFYSGLIQQLSLGDAEIAVVMGHEISHALREHSREQVSQAIAAQTAIEVGAALLGAGGGSANLASAAYQALIATKFSRVDESEADRMGLELTARAGYDPRAGISLWQKMMKANQGGRAPEFFSTHPAESNRIQQIESLLPAVMPLYEAARRRS
jgi:predicted Zn-dependent protease